VPRVEVAGYREFVRAEQRRRMTRRLFERPAAHPLRALRGG